MYTNIYTHSRYRRRRRETARHERRHKSISSAEQRHRITKLSSTGMDVSHIAQQLGLKRKAVRHLLEVHHYAPLPKSLARAFKNAGPPLPAGPLYVVFDRSEWQPVESSVAAAGHCTGCLAA